MKNDVSIVLPRCIGGNIKYKNVLNLQTKAHRLLYWVNFTSSSLISIQRIYPV